MIVFFCSGLRPTHVLTGIILHEPTHVGTSYISSAVGETSPPRFSFPPSLGLLALPCLCPACTTNIPSSSYISPTQSPIPTVHRPSTTATHPQPIHFPFPLLSSPFLFLPFPRLLHPKTHAHTHTRTSGKKGGHRRTQLTPAMSHSCSLPTRLPARPACPFCFKKYKKQTLQLLLTSRHHQSDTHTHSFLFSSSFPFSSQNSSW